MQGSSGSSSSSSRKREGARVVLAVVAAAAEVQRLVDVRHVGLACDAAHRQVHLTHHRVNHEPFAAC